MKMSNLTALLVVIVSATVAAPGYVAAAGCCPGSGCCGTGQTYVGQPLFAVPGAPSQVQVAPTVNAPQIVKAASMVVTDKKGPAAQTQAVPVLRLAPQAAGQSLDVLTFSCSPCLGTLW